MSSFSRRTQGRWALFSVLSGALLASPSFAYSNVNLSLDQQSEGSVEAADVQFSFDLPADGLLQTIGRISSITKNQIILQPDVRVAAKTSIIKGTYTVTDLLDQVLTPLGLEYRFNPDGTYIVQNAPQEVSQDQLVRYQDIEQPAITEEIFVTGSYTVQSMNGATGLNMSLRETPQSVSIVTRQLIEDFAITDMSTVLKNVPGVSMTGDASEDYLIYVRGFNMDASIQVDGMITTTANSAYSGSTSQGIDPVIAERVEVLKGAAGILSGLGEPSATVNMIRKRPKSEAQGSLMLRAGRWDTYRLEADYSSPLNESGSVRARAVGSYQSNDSFLERYEREKYVVYGVIEADVASATQVSLAVDHMNSEASGVYNWNSNPAFFTDGSPIEADRSFSTGQDWSFRNVKETSIMPEIEHEFDNGWFIKTSYRYADGTIDVLNGTPGDYVDRETGNYVSSRPEFAFLNSDRKSKTQSFNIYATGAFALFGREHEFVGGYSYNKNEFDIASTSYRAPIYNYYDDDVFAEPDYNNPTREDLDERTQKQTGFYGTLRLNPADALKIMLGGRLSSWNYNIDYQQFGDTPLTRPTVSVNDSGIFTPYAGVVYDLNDFASVYASFTGIFLPVTNRDADGNILEPTEGTNFEAGFKLAFFDNELNIAGAVYRTNKDNVAEWAGLGRLPNGEWIYQSVDGIKTDGFEIEIAGAITPEWNISAGYTYNKAVNKDGNKRNNYIPTSLVKLTTTYDLAGILDGVTIGGSFKWQSRTFESGGVYLPDNYVPLTHIQPAYLLVDLMASYDISEAVSLSVNATNLFDKKYFRSLWGYADFGEPLNVSAALRWNF